MKQDSERPVLVVDFDGVVGNISNGMHESCAKRAGMARICEEWYRYDGFRDYGLTMDQFLESLVEHNVLETAVMTPGASGALKLARDNGLDLVIVTARGFHPDGKKVTLDWCSKHDIVVDDIRLVGASGSKQEAVASLKNVVGYVDDLSSHLDSVAAIGADFPLYLMDQPWNRDCKTYKRITRLDQYVEGVLHQLYSTVPTASRASMG